MAPEPNSSQISPTLPSFINIFNKIQKDTFLVYNVYRNVAGLFELHHMIDENESQLRVLNLNSKPSYGVGLKSAQAWDCPFSMKCLFKDISLALAPSLPLLCV
jgi:hypothetical protein